MEWKGIRMGWDLKNAILKRFRRRGKLDSPRCFFQFIHIDSGAVLRIRWCQFNSQQDLDMQTNGHASSPAQNSDLYKVH